MGKLSRRPSRATRPGRSDAEAQPGWLQLITENIQWLNRDYPGWFELLNVVRAARDDLGGWPDWCLVPLVPSIYLFSQAYQTDSNPDITDHFGIMTALFAWEHTRTVWHFDDELARALEDTTSLDSVPSELMYRLPGWAVATPIGEAVAITWLDHNPSPDRGPSLQIFVLSRDEDELLYTPIVIPLRYRTLGEGLRALLTDVGGFERYAQERPESAAQLQTLAASLNIDPEDVINETDTVGHRLAKQIVARLCYLLAEEPDISERVPPEPHRGRARRQARLGTPQVQPVRELDVGFRVGAALRAARAAESHSFATDDEPVGHRRSPVPHLRRAHWHLYWTGPRQGPRTPVLRWIPPVVVAASNAEDVVVPTVRPVRGPSQPKSTV
jgi:hypothetical protein